MTIHAEHKSTLPIFVPTTRYFLGRSMMSVGLTRCDGHEERFQRSTASYAVSALLKLTIGSNIALVTTRATSMSLLEKLDARAPITVLVTGACGQIAYKCVTCIVAHICDNKPMPAISDIASKRLSCAAALPSSPLHSLIFLIARGDMLGADQPVILHLLDIPAFESKLEAVVMELEDIASPVLTAVRATTSYEVAFAGVDVALLVGARPRGPGMERADLLTANAAIFRGQGDALNRLASRDVKVLVVGNPANTNALIAARAAPSLPRSSFTALTRLDQNRGTGMIARRLGVVPARVKTVIIWGNHSTTQFPDARFAVVTDLPRPGDVAGVPALVNDTTWLNTTFVEDIQQRGKAVIDKRGASSAASAAEAITNHVRDWVLGSAGNIISMGEYKWRPSDDRRHASYDTPALRYYGTCIISVCPVSLCWFFLIMRTTESHAALQASGATAQRTASATLRGSFSPCP